MNCINRCLTVKSVTGQLNLVSDGFTYISVLFIAPVPTPPTSYRTEDTSGSDHGTTVHVNIPSAESVRDGVPQSAAEQAELAVRITQ